jgi:hypothetical protein
VYAFAVRSVAAIATLLREDCLTPIPSAFAFPLVPPYLSPPRFARWIDPAGRRAFPGGALITRWTPRGVFGSALCRDFLDRRPMRLSRVPVLSLYQHALVSDPGGRCPVSPRATGQIRRSRGVTLSAVPTPRLRPPGVVIPCGTTTFTQLSRLDTDPADLLPPASDVCRLAPAGFATGLVASLCPWKDLHLLDNLNRFHRGSHPRIPSVTSLTRHDTPWLGASAAAPPHIRKEQGQPTRFVLSSRTDRGSS